MISSYIDPYAYGFYYNLFTPRWRIDALSRSSLRIAHAPVQEPVSLDEAAMHLNIDAYGSPAEYPNAPLISALIIAAREYVEGMSGCMLAPQVVELGVRNFDNCWSSEQGISLRTGPVTGILEVNYIDENGAAQVLDSSNYDLDYFASPARIYLASGGSWPALRDQPNAVRIRFNAGYDIRGSSPSDNEIPQSLRAAILLVLGHLYENREETISGTIISQLPLGVTALLQRYRITDPLA